MPNIDQYHGKSSPNQHIHHFYSLIENVMGNTVLMTRLFVGSLKEIALDWFRTLLVRSIKSWADLEGRFLTRFYEDNTKGFIPILIEEKQKKSEPVKRFCQEI